MMNQTLEEEILDQLDKLPPEQQRRVLDFARALASAKPAGKPGKELLAFGGAIEIAELNIMAQAIEEGCEKIIE